MKVAYIITKFPAPSETFAANDVKALNKKGVNVSVYAQRGSDSNSAKMIEDRGLEGVQISSCTTMRYLLGLLYSFVNFSVLFKALCWMVAKDYSRPKHLIKCVLLLPSSFYILKELEKARPDIVHLFWGHYPAVVGYLVKRKLLGVRLSMFLGAYDLEYKLGISRSLAEEADCIFTHAKVNVAKLKELGVKSRDVNVVYRGVDTSRLLSFTKDSTVKRKGKWVTAGRLMEAKGFQTVLSLFSEFVEKGIASELVVAGDGPYKSELRKIASDLGVSNQVRFTGHISQKELFCEMSESEVFLLLSQKQGERLPNVVKEAMLAGCVCVTTRSPGIDELIRNGLDGVIVDQSDIGLFAPVLPEILGDKEAVIRMGQSAHEQIVNKFEITRLMESYVRAWQSGP